MAGFGSYLAQQDRKVNNQLLKASEYTGDPFYLIALPRLTTHTFVSATTIRRAYPGWSIVSRRKSLIGLQGETESHSGILFPSANSQPQQVHGSGEAYSKILSWDIICSVTILVRDATACRQVKPMPECLITAEATGIFYIIVHRYFFLNLWCLNTFVELSSWLAYYQILPNSFNLYAWWYLWLFWCQLDSHGKNI